jgi:hypothetical protein
LCHWLGTDVEVWMGRHPRAPQTTIAVAERPIKKKHVQGRCFAEIPPWHGATEVLHTSQTRSPRCCHSSRKQPAPGLSLPACAATRRGMHENRVGEMSMCLDPIIMLIVLMARGQTELINNVLTDDVHEIPVSSICRF